MKSPEPSRRGSGRDSSAAGAAPPALSRVGSGGAVATDAVLAHLAGETGCGDWKAHRKPLRRRNCEIHFVRSERFRRPELVLKIYLPGAVKPNLARDLFLKSQACHEASTDTCTVPEPILCCPEQNAWVMERIHVPTLGVRLKTGFPSRGARETINRAAAEWLTWFHHCSPVANAPFDAGYFLGKLANLHGKVGQLAPLLLERDAFLGDCIEMAGDVARGLHGVSMPHASAHGDFTPFNLFARARQTIGFDYLANRRLPVSFDICRFMLYLDLYRLVPASAAELREFGCRKADYEGFMEAYGGDQEWAGGDRWIRFQFLEVTRRITSLALRRSEGRKFPFGVIETACMRRTARLLMETLR